MSRGEKVFVTGATGFVGACLVRRLVSLGTEVHILLRSTSPWWRIEDLRDQVVTHIGDLLDAPRLREVVRSVEPDYIYHTATYGAYPAQTDAERILRTTVLGTLNLLSAASEVDYRLLVNCGSSSEYGFKPQPMRESDVPQPNSYYAVGKCSQTLLAQYAAHADNRPVVTLRLFSVYGPYEEWTRFVPTLIRACLDGQPMRLADPKSARDFVFVDDVLDAMLKWDRLPLCRGEICNVASGRQRTIGEVAELALRVTGARIPLLYGEMEPRPWDTSTWVGDSSKTERLLGWRAETTLEQGLALTVEWTRAHRGLQAAVQSE